MSFTAAVIPSRRRTLVLAAFVALQFLAPLSPAQIEQAEFEEPDFNLGIAEKGAVNSDNPFSIADSGFAGNPTRSLFSWWPEDLILAPIPSRSPELGWTLAFLGGYFLDLDKAHPDTPASVVGAAAMVTENDSFGGGLGGNLHLNNDNWRVSAGAVYIDLKYAFYGIGDDAGDRGTSVDIAQKMPYVFASAMYKVRPNTYLGLAYSSGQVETSIRLTLPTIPDFPDPSFDLDISALQIPFQYDTRDHGWFPRSGWFVDGRATFYREFLGADLNAESLQVSINRYLSVRQRDVLALRAYLRAIGGDVPFFLLSSFGGTTDLRGYRSGRYRDSMMYAVQAEYRWQPRDRWIFTGFAGVGDVAPNIGSFFNNLLPAAGAGARYVLSKKHKINLALDVAAGIHGAEIYFGVGEAF